MSESSNNRLRDAYFRQLEIEYNLLSPSSQRALNRSLMRGHRVVQRIESRRSERVPKGKAHLTSLFRNSVKKVVDHVDKRTRRKTKRKPRRRRRVVGK